MKEGMRQKGMGWLFFPPTIRKRKKVKTGLYLLCENTEAKDLLLSPTTLQVHSYIARYPVCGIAQSTPPPPPADLSISTSLGSIQPRCNCAKTIPQLSVLPGTHLYS